MPAIGGDHMTYLDLVKRTNPDGTAAQIVEALAQRNAILKDAHVHPGNLTDGHRVTIQDGLPTVGFRKLNQGVDKSSSTTVQVDESCGLMEGRSVVDCELLRIHDNPMQARATEDRSFLTAMNILAAQTLFYGSTKTNPEKFHGIMPRYDSLTGADNSENVIDAGLTPGGNDQASILFWTWGPDTAFLTFPKNTDGGFTQEDMGKEYEEDRDGKKFLAWRTHFIWRLGLVVKDWRYHVRICNIDLGDITATGTELLTAMIKAYNHVYDLDVGRTVIYCNRTVRTWIDLQVYNKTNLWFQPVEWHGKMISGFRGIPVLINDAMAANEGQVT